MRCESMVYPAVASSMRLPSGIVDEEVALSVGSITRSVSDLNSGGFDGFECGVQVIDLKSDVPTGWCSVSRLDEMQHTAIFGAGPD